MIIGIDPDKLTLDIFFVKQVISAIGVLSGRRIVSQNNSGGITVTGQYSNIAILKPWSRKKNVVDLYIDNTYYKDSTWIDLELALIKLTPCDIDNGEYKFIDWASAPIWANFWAVDFNGVQRWYSERPQPQEHQYYTDRGQSAIVVHQVENWRRSLTARPGG